MRYSIVRAVWKAFDALAGKRLVKAYGVVASFSAPVPEGAFLLLANHAHARDPYVLGSLIGRPIRYMANIEGVSSLAAAFSGLAGAFGKRKGMPDLSALRAAIGYLKSGEPVGIFPEGDRSWDGKTAPINSGIARLARLAGVPILLARQRGSYLTGPRWAGAKRRGRWAIEFSIISADRIASASLESLADEIRAGLEGDDVAWAAKSGVRFRCVAPARGASRALWACPDCGAAGSLFDDDTSIRCSSCGGAWAVDANCALSRLSGTGRSFIGSPGWSPGGASADRYPRDLPAWISWQRAYAASGCAPAAKARIAGLAMISPAPRKAYGPGTLSTTADGLSFKPDTGAKPIVFLASRMEGFVDNFKKYCSFSYGRERWRLEQGGSSTLMWVDIAVALAARWAKGA